MWHKVAEVKPHSVNRLSIHKDEQILKHLLMQSALGGFFLACEDFGRMFDHPFPVCAFSFLFEMEISSRTLVLVFMPGSVHSSSASWDDCGRMFPDTMRVSSLSDTLPHYAWTAAKSAHSDIVGSRVYVCLGVTCHLHFCQNDRGLLCATAVTRGWNGHRIRISTQS